MKCFELCTKKGLILFIKKIIVVFEELSGIVD